VKRVGVALEFITVNDAVDDRYVDPAGAMFEPQLFHDQHIRVRERFRKNLLHDGGSNIAIACSDTRRLIAV